MGAMNETMHDYVVTKLQATNRQVLARVAKDTGISESTIRKIKYRHVKDPGVSFIERLNQYFRDQPLA